MWNKLMEYLIETSTKIEISVVHDEDEYRETIFTLKFPFSYNPSIENLHTISIDIENIMKDSKYENRTFNVENDNDNIAMIVKFKEKWDDSEDKKINLSELF